MPDYNVRSYLRNLPEFKEWNQKLTTEKKINTLLISIKDFIKNASGKMLPGTLIPQDAFLILRSLLSRLIFITQTHMY